jgi:hypothetical protein
MKTKIKFPVSLFFTTLLLICAAAFNSFGQTLTATSATDVAPDAALSDPAIQQYVSNNPNDPCVVAFLANPAATDIYACLKFQSVLNDPNNGLSAEELAVIQNDFNALTTVTQIAGRPAPPTQAQQQNKQWIQQNSQGNSTITVAPAQPNAPFSTMPPAGTDSNTPK